MDFEVLDSVKFEKAKAIARFNRFRRMTKLFQFFELIVVLMLISWSCTRVPVIVRFSGDFLVELWNYVCNPHVVFVIGNAIIVALFLLCRRTEIGCDSVVSDLYSDGGEEISRGEAQPPVVSSEVSAPPLAVATGDGGDETKHIVCTESAVENKPQCNEISTAMKTATKQIEKFQRTQSEKLKRAIALKPQRELRRAETVVHRKVVDSDGTRAMPRVETVENLNSDEFRLTVEKFIRKNQEFFKIESNRDERPIHEYLQYYEYR